MWKSAGLLLIFLTLTTSIYIPLSGNQKRCMIVYSVGQSETVKLDINFPEIPGMENYEPFQLSWENTQSNQITRETVKSGRYRRELSLTPNVIYDLCIQANVNRDYGVIYVEYSASNIFSVNQAEIKVPQNILKSKDITDAYLNAQNIDKVLLSFQTMQENRTQTHAQIFRKKYAISQKLVQISIGELIVVVLAGVWQLYSVFQYLKKKNFI